PNRVYVRARTPSGMPVEVQGRLVDGEGHEVAAVRTAAGHGLGAFLVTPRAGQTYTLRIESPTGIETKAALPEVLVGGVGLHVPSDAGDPVRVVLHHAGEARPVVVAAFAKGQLVAQEWATLRPGATEVLLRPAGPAAGVLRVTVYDPVGGVPRPVAERLVYRAPTDGLRLTL